MSLFDEKRSEEHSEKDKPLATRLSPEDFDEFYGQEKIIAEKGPIRKLISRGWLPSCIFYGPPGSGKSALANIIAKKTGSEFLKLNAVTAKSEDLRKAFDIARQNRMLGKKTILFIDEIHRFNKMQQDGLLPALEDGLVTLIGTTTHNPYFYLIPPLRSRVLLFQFEKLEEKDLNRILDSAEKKLEIRLNKEVREFLVRFANGDARRMLNLLEAGLKIKDIGEELNISHLKTLIDKQSLIYDRDEDYHYDIISAYIKSIRGSDPDAAIYWLARMLEAGEDPLYIARRLIILASEDIGLADNFSIILANAAYHAVDTIGMPEARIILAHATLYLALQPKSNSSYRAISEAIEYVKKTISQEVPPHLRSSVRAEGEYKYPHDFEYHFVPQKYMDEDVRFYKPDEKPLGDEREFKKRYDFYRNLAKKLEERDGKKVQGKKVQDGRRREKENTDKEGNTEDKGLNAQK